MTTVILERRSNWVVLHCKTHIFPCMMIELSYHEILMTQQYTSLLRNIPFFILLLNCLFAMFGDGLTYIMLVWSLVEQNPSVHLMAILLLLYWFPSSTLGPFFGTLADKYSLKKLFLITNGFQASIFLYYAWLGKSQYHLIDLYILSGCTGIFLAMYMPVLMTLVRKSVKEDVLIFANTIIDICDEMGSVIGMAFAGLLLNFLTYPSFMLLNGTIYLLGFLLLLVMRDPPHATENTKAKSIFDLFIEGSQYFIYNHLILIVYCIQALLFVCLMTAPVLLAPYAKIYLHTGIAEYAWLEIALSAGVVIGGIGGAWFASRFSIHKTLLAQILISIVSLHFFSHTQSIRAGLYYQFLIGTGFAAWALSTTLAQQITDINYQSRVQSISNCLSGALMMAFFTVLYLLKNVSIHHLYQIEMGFLSLAAVLLLWFIKLKHR